MCDKKSDNAIIKIKKSITSFLQLWSQSEHTVYIVLESLKSLLLTVENILHVKGKLTQQRQKEVPVRNDKEAA